MNKEIGPKFSTLFIVMLFLVIIYYAMIYCATYNNIVGTNTGYNIDDIAEIYDIPSILVNDNTKCEVTAEGVVHVYNDLGELIASDIDSIDILGTVNDSNEKIEKEVSDVIINKLGDKYSNVIVRTYGNETYSVSYNKDELSYGVVLLDVNKKVDIENYIVDVISDIYQQNNTNSYNMEK